MGVVIFGEQCISMLKGLEFGIAQSSTLFQIPHGERAMTEDGKTAIVEF
jgi:hypothetical protein